MPPHSRITSIADFLKSHDKGTHTSLQIDRTLADVGKGLYQPIIVTPRRQSNQLLEDRDYLVIDWVSRMVEDILNIQKLGTTTVAECRKLLQVNIVLPRDQQGRFFLYPSVDHLAKGVRDCIEIFCEPLPWDEPNWWFITDRYERYYSLLAK